MIVAKRRHNGHRVAQGTAELDATITWISDTHFVNQYVDDEESAGVSDRAYYTVGAKLREFVEYTNYIVPDLAIHTGDAWDQNAYVQIPILMSETYLGGIDESIRFEIIPGNHEMQTISPTDLAPLYGRVGASLVGGSLFHQSFDIGDTTKIIFFDATTYPNEETGRADSTRIAWLDSELRAAGAAGKKRCIVFGHMVPHNYAATGTFDETDALAIAAMASSACEAYPDMRIAYCGGHAHPPTLRDYTNFHPRFVGYVTTSFVHSIATNAITVIKTFKDGDIAFEIVPVTYPYTNIVPT